MPAGARPERDLRRLLERLPDVPLRRNGLAKLSQLEEARQRVEAAAGDPARVDSALSELEQTFVDLTGASPLRHAGRTYGARTTVYRDCHRDVELVLGADFRRALEPLELVIQSGFWLTFRMRERLDAHLRDVYERLRQDGDDRVVLSEFWFECLPILHEAAPPILDELVTDFQQRWRAILRYGPDDARVRYAAADVAEAVLESFAAPSCGWDGARYCSPDVMIAASDVDAIRRGDFEIVLGDFHLAVNAARSQLFFEQHPAQDQLLAEVDVDYPAPRLLPVLPKENPPRLTGRTQPALIRDVDYLVALFHQTVDPRRARLLLSGDVTVGDDEGRLVVAVGPDETFDVVDVFAEAVLGLMLDAVTLSAPEAHSPRVTLDRVVVTRETWHVPVGELGFALEKSEAMRYLNGRSWARRAELPRHVFVSSPLELKPFYVDFDSPIYVNLLAKAIRRVVSASGEDAARQMKFVEMLPSLEQTWLVDREGRRYTSELRLVAVAGSC